MRPSAPPYQSRTTSSTRYSQTPSGESRAPPHLPIGPEQPAQPDIAKHLQVSHAPQRTSLSVQNNQLNTIQPTPSGESRAPAHLPISPEQPAQHDTAKHLQVSHAPQRTSLSVQNNQLNRIQPNTFR